MTNPVLAQFGLDSADLDTQDPEFDMIPVVTGRIAHIDADFICYEIASVNKADADKIAAGTKEPETLDELFASSCVVMRRMTRKAGAESFVAHLTPSATTKGNRALTAITKPYQANRIDKVKPEHLDALRGMLGCADFGVIHLDQEADDGLTQANYAAAMRGEADLSVIISKDKDLRMAPGLHWDFDTEEIVDIPLGKFGWLYQEQHKLPSGKMSPKKTLGYGPAFFWAQCLMGDTADNIAGLPKIGGDFLFKNGIGKAGQAARQCGAVMAFKLLEKCASNIDAFKIVYGAYATSPHTFINHHTQEECTPFKALGGDMRSLWMRREEGDDDFTNFFSSDVLPYIPAGYLEQFAK